MVDKIDMDSQNVEEQQYLLRENIDQLVLFISASQHELIASIEFVGMM